MADPIGCYTVPGTSFLQPSVSGSHWPDSSKPGLLMTPERGKISVVTHRRGNFHNIWLAAGGVTADGEAYTGDVVLVADGLLQQPIPYLPGKYGRAFSFVLGYLRNHLSCGYSGLRSADSPGADGPRLVIPTDMRIKARRGNVVTTCISSLSFSSQLMTGDSGRNMRTV